MVKKYQTYLFVEIITLTLFCSILNGSEAEELGVIIERNVPVPMRDGTILRADVHRPDRGGPYPVLVQRTPYGKGGNFNRFVKAGYIVVCQDVRGRYASNGKYESYMRFKTHDAEDGYDTVEWAAKLSGSNGKVGTFGVSYPAFLQWRLAPLRPPSLLAMSACSIPARFPPAEGPGTIRPGPELPWWMVNMVPDMQRRANQPGVHTVLEARKLWHSGESEKWLNFLPWFDLPRDVFGDETGAVKYWLKNPHLDPWRLDEGCKDISVPNLDITGWHDYNSARVLLFQTMVKEAKTKVARNGSRIIIGPWSHHAIGERRYGSIDFGPEASLDITALRIRWFDYWLKGKPNAMDKDPPVKIFVMGDNKWRDEQCWPLRRTKEKTLFLISDGRANTPTGGGNLVEEKPGQSGTDQYVYDPKDPVPSLYGISSLIRAVDQRPLAKREDILVYQTEPLIDRVEVTGNPVVELYATSSAPDTDWFVRLIDVAPDGLARNVSVGMVRARYREGLDKPTLLKPGKKVKYTILMSPTSNAFLPGHRIRLDITSSDFPNYDRNHNTAANQNADTTLVIAKQTVYHGGEQATRIILPWLPNPIEQEKCEFMLKKQVYQLHQAAANGDIEQVKLFISKGADINAEDEKKKTPLHYAAEVGKMEVVQLLVKAGADVNAGRKYWPPLCVAVDNNHIPVAEYLIDHGADVNPGNNWTPLQQASASGSIEMVELLIARGADINVGEGYWTVLHDAVSRRRRDIAELLIQKGVDVNAKDKDGHAPLYYTIWQRDLDTAKLLITKDADVNVEDSDGMPLLYWALYLDNNDVAKLLLAGDAGFAWKDKNGLGALHYAALNGNQDITNVLLAKGAKVDERDDNYEFTALQYAARFGHKNVAELLIANGADIRAKDKWDYEPIHWAAYHDRADVVELLISKGADINAKTSLGQTPIQLALERRNKETVELLRKHGAGISASRDVSRADSSDISFSIKREVLHKIDPRIFGQFMERPSWGEIGVEGALIPGTRKIQPRVLDLLKEMEIPVIRFPGGTDVDFLDWRDMVDNVPGRAAQRPVSTGHRGHKVTNNFGYDEFLQFCEDVGAQAILVVNFRDALLRKKPLKEAAIHAAALVAYCNAPVGAKLPEGMYNWPSLRAGNGRAESYKVKYFQIGNETWAFIKQLKQILPDTAPQFYLECLAAYIEAMRSVDPSIEIIVDGHDGNMSGIVGQVHEQLGDKISYFATHFYSPWAITKVVKGDKEVLVHEISADEIWRAWVAVTWFDENGRSIINHPGINAARRLGYKVAVTEWNWNGWWRYNGPGAALNSSFAKGLGAAGYLHAFMRAADVIELGCQSMLLGNSWGITSIKADAEGKVPPFYMPSGQVTMFYSKHHGDKLLALVSRNVPTYKQPYRMGGIRPKGKVAYIDALATAGQRHIYFHAINRSFEQSVDITVDVSAFGRLEGRAVHHVLQGRLNDVPEPDEPRQIGRITQKDIHFDGKMLTATLPHRSVSCIEFMQK